MEQFRQILKAAIAEKIQRIRLQGGELAIFTRDGLSEQMHQLPRIEHSEFAGMFQFLLPDYATQKLRPNPVTGILQVPQVGAIQLFADDRNPAGMMLYLYLPGGEAQFRKDVDQMMGRSTASPPPPPPARSNPPAPLSTARSGPASSTKDDAVLDPSMMFAIRGKASLPVAATSSAVKVPETLQPTYQVPKLKMPALEPESASAEAEEASDPFRSHAPAPWGEMSSDMTIVEPAASKQEVPGPVAPMRGSTPANAVVQGGFGLGAVAREDGESISHGENQMDALLTEMVERKASDMHMTSDQPVALRIDGDIIRIATPPIGSQMMMQYLEPLMPERNRREFAAANDTDFAYELAGIGRFRVNVFRDRYGVGAVLRHIPSKILTTEQLNLPLAIMKLCQLNKGLVLVTGPTGSGKSTTLAAMIDWINKNRKEHILTIEDPIEFVHAQHQCLVNQREVHKHTGSFARALKAALREDPDVILVGEMRDLETIAIAVETAETGHLVFGTLHTSTAISSVDRIIDQFPSERQEQIRTMLAGSLRGVVTQTLLKKLGGGRIAAHEILIVNDAVSSMIREGKNHMIGNHMLTQKADGNQMLNETLLKMISEGLIDPQEALFKAVDKNDFVLAAARRNIRLAS